MILINTYRPDLSGTEAVARVGAAFPGIPVLHLEEALSETSSLDSLLLSLRTFRATSG
jgi:hypothetical protein